MDFDPRAKGAALRLDEIVTGDGRRLGACLKQEIVRELDRLSLVMEQLSRVEAERDAVVDMGRRQEASAADHDRDAAMIAVLNRLKGIGTDASILVREAFWRSFRNRRELGGWSGMAPSPWASGSVSRDQGITKAGPPMLRAQMIQITWRWLFWQPDSDLARWFRKDRRGDGPDAAHHGGGSRTQASCCPVALRDDGDRSQRRHCDLIAAAQASNSRTGRYRRECRADV
ncbi:transposase [Mesorhizobium australicum]|uniref:transposase n=1 Tax=Mesorhizobium australicum TaxID=536018 RepID=UPI00333A6109